jgi:hypothetical protein
MLNSVVGAGEPVHTEPESMTEESFFAKIEVSDGQKAASVADHPPMAHLDAMRIMR